MTRTLPEILADLQSRTLRGSPAFYKPLSDLAERQLAHQHYRLQLKENYYQMLRMPEIRPPLQKNRSKS